MIDLTNNDMDNSFSLEFDLPPELYETYFFYLNVTYKRFPNMDRKILKRLYEETFTETILFKLVNYEAKWNFPNKIS
jgi:hypothetical protein